SGKALAVLEQKRRARRILHDIVMRHGAEELFANQAPHDWETASERSYQACGDVVAIDGEATFGPPAQRSLDAVRNGSRRAQQGSGKISLRIHEARHGSSLHGSAAFLAARGGQARSRPDAVGRSPPS